MWDPEFDDLLRRELPFLSSEEPLDDDLPLRDYGLDSLGTVQLLSALEATYQIRFSDDALTLETFRTPAVLWQALSAIRAAAN